MSEDHQFDDLVKEYPVEKPVSILSKLQELRAKYQDCLSEACEIIYAEIDNLITFHLEMEPHYENIKEHMHEAS